MQLMKVAVENNNKVHVVSFVEPFISRLSEYILQNYVKRGKDLSRLAVVFGGKRPSLYLKRELARGIGQPFVSLPFLIIDEFISGIVQKTTAIKHMPQMDHGYLIYRLAGEVAPEILRQRESFAKFMPWAGEIIQLIDHLDLEMVSSAALRNIEANAQIGYSVPEDINRLLEHVLVLREAYHDYLEKHTIFSRGFQYLWAARRVSEAVFDEYEEILFCNFFYLHRSESKIIQEIYRRGQARIFLQGDERRWPALQRMSKIFNVPVLEGEEVLPPQFDLKLYAASDVHVQTSIARDILKGIPNPDQAVVVLPDPETLVPLLSEIASIVPEFNVSMGYPLCRSSLSSLLEAVFQAQLSRRKSGYYARDYLKVLRHPFVKNLKLSTDSSAVRVLVHKMEELLTGRQASEISGRIFLELDDIVRCRELYASTEKTLQHMEIAQSEEGLKLILHSMHEVLFGSWESVEDFQAFAQALERVMTLMLHKSFMDAYPLNIKIAQRISEIAEELQQAQFAREKFPIEEMIRIFKGRIDQEMISFRGSPLKGLQILGLFETRSLSFQHVIVLDVNEGVLPHLKIHEPLIPREVLVKLNLDRLELEEEIQRYHFMRLLSSAQKVHLIYRESADKEKSRFVHELIWEQEKKLKVLNPVAVERPGFPVAVVPFVRQAEKTAAMVELLKNFRYSASSVNCYLRNPYDFYMKYVLGLKAQEDLLDEPENREVGVFIHGLLQDMYQRFLGRKIMIDQNFRKDFMRSFEERFAAVFGRSMRSDGFLLKSVLESRLARFLDQEEHRSLLKPSRLLYVEKRFEDVIDLSVGPVRFVYQVDRVNEYDDGTVEIIDYKAGSVDPMPAAPGKIAALTMSREAIRDHVKSFQIPLYYYYLDKQFPGKMINAAFYNLRTLQIDYFVKDQSIDRGQINTLFLKLLDFVIGEIINPEIPFVFDEPAGV